MNQERVNATSERASAREVIIKYCRDGKERRASGFHLCDDLILTAGHVTGAENASYLVEYCGRTLSDGSLIWEAFTVTGGAVDIGLIRVPGLPAVQRMRIALLDRARSETVRCTGVVFPTYQVEGQATHLVGDLMLRSGQSPLGGASGIITLQLIHDGPRLDAEHPDPAERWACASGGAILAHATEQNPNTLPLCVGVVSQHASGETARTLRVATFDPLTPEGAFPGSGNDFSEFWDLVGQDPALTQRIPQWKTGPRVRLDAENRPSVANGFVPRAEQAQLRQHCHQPGAAPMTLVAENGARGVGCTQLASYHAGECVKSGWDLVIWIRASTRFDVEADLAKAASKMNVAPSAASASEKARALVEWLNARPSDQRLMVFDDLNDREDVAGLLPEPFASRVIVTTTNSDQVIGVPLMVGAIPTRDAAFYLQRQTGLDDDQGAEAVATAVGGLPIALSAIVAGMNLRELDFASYQAKVIDPVTPGRMAHVADAFPPRGPGFGARDAVRTTLRWAIEAIVQKNSSEDSAHAQVLQEVVGALAILGEHGLVRSWLDVLAEKTLLVDHAVEALCAAGIVQLSEDGYSATVNRLYCEELRRKFTLGGETDVPHRAALAIFERVDPLGSVGRDARENTLKEIVRKLRPTLHQRDFITLDPDGHFFSIVVHVLNVAEVLAVPHLATKLVDALELASSTLGNGHPHTETIRRCLVEAFEKSGEGLQDAKEITARESLANAYITSGLIRRAIPLFQACVLDRDLLFGPFHSETIRSRYSLAHALVLQGEPERAVIILRSALRDHEKAFGSADPRLEAARRQLARTYLILARTQMQDEGLESAIALLEEVVARYEGLYLDIPDYYRALRNLGAISCSAGDAKRAVSLLGPAVAGLSRMLGADSLETLEANYDLAVAHEMAGSLPRSLEIFQMTFASLKSRLGRDHLQTLEALEGLARVYASLGRLENAISCLESAVAGRKVVMEADHRDTLRTEVVLCRAYGEVGRWQDSIQLLTRTLKSQERELGSDHPETLATCHELATAYASTGRDAESLVHHERVLIDRERVLGIDHVDTIASRHEVARAYLASDRATAAVGLLEGVLASRERLLGGAQEVTITTSKELAEAYISLGRVEEARETLTRAVDASVRYRGSRHPITRSIVGARSQLLQERPSRLGRVWFGRPSTSRGHR